MFRKYDLQLFAQRPTVVTGTENYVDPYTGTTTVFDDQNSMTAEMKTFYDTALLVNARPNLVYAQFGRKQGLPAHRGKTVEFRKPNKLPVAKQLTEGVIPDAEKFGVTAITAALTQHGLYASITDQVETHTVDNVLAMIVEELGASAGLTMDTLVRNEVCGGTAVQYCDKVSGTTHTTVTSRSAIDKTAKLTPEEVNKAVMELKKKLAPTINGKYIAVIHPAVAYDLRQSDQWIEAHKYASPEEIYNGEIGELHGVRFVETTQAKIFGGKWLSASARNLTVASYASGAITIDEALSADDATAMAGRKIMIGTALYTVASATAGTASNAKITISETPTTNPADGDVVYPGEGGAAGTAVYATMFFGKDAFAEIDPEGAGLSMIMKDKSQVGGPLEQFSTAGYKVSTATKRLYEDRMLRVESGATTGDIDQEN